LRGGWADGEHTSYVHTFAKGERGALYAATAFAHTTAMLSPAGVLNIAYLRVWWFVLHSAVRISWRKYSVRNMVLILQADGVYERITAVEILFIFVHHDKKKLSDIDA